MHKHVRNHFPLLFAILSLTAVPLVFGQSGHVLNGVGPLDQGMSGAGMAAPRGALAPLHWNPAALSRLDRSRLDISLQILEPKGEIHSTVNQGAFGEMGPPVAVSGSTESAAGPFSIPAIGFVHASPNSAFSWGISAFGVGGFGVDYSENPLFSNPMDPSTLDPTANPILTPQPPAGGIGFAALNSEFALFQVAPTLSYAISPTVSVGFAPTFNYALLTVEPFPGGIAGYD